MPSQINVNNKDFTYPKFSKVPRPAYAYNLKHFIMHGLKTKIIIMLKVILPKIYPAHVAANIEHN